MTIEETTWKYANSLEFNNELRLKLEEEYNINPMDTEDVFTSSQLSKIELRKDYIYIALQFPEFNIQTRTFAPKELHIFVSHSYIFLINKHDLKHAQNFHTNRNLLISENENIQSSALFYELLDFCITNEYRVLRKFRREIDQLSIDIFDSKKNNDKIISIQEIKRNLVDFISLIEPLREVLVDMQNRYHVFIDAQGIEKLDDSLDKIKKMLNNLKNFQQQVNIFSETNEALTARSTDKSIRRLTLINVILLVPNIITSFFGMNVYFGWNEFNSLPVVIISLFILTLTILILLLIRYTRLFI